MVEPPSEDDFATELTRRLQQGEREKLAEWLEHYALQHPDVPQAAAELARLRSGIPLRAEMEAATQRERALREQRQELLRLLRDKQLPRTSKGLRRTAAALEHLCAAVGERLTAEERQQLAERQRAIRDAQKKLFRRRWCPVVALGGCAAVLALAVWPALRGMQEKAEALPPRQAPPATPKAPETAPVLSPAALTAERQPEEAPEQPPAPAAETTPTPPETPADSWSTPAADEPKLQALINRLQSSADTPETKQQLEQAEAALTALQQFTQLQEALPVAQDYGVYLSLVRAAQADAYPPAAQALGFRTSLPASEALTDLIKLRDHRLTKSEEDELEHVLLRGGATFSPMFPARAEQLQLLHDLCSNRALHQKLIRVLTAQGESFVSDELPSTANGELRFRRSALDPTLRADEDPNIRRDRVEAARMFICDPTPLYQALGLQNENTATQLNLLHALTTTLNAKAPQCPAAARAYIYHRLLSIAQMANNLAATGVAFSPKLQRDAASFHALCAKWGEPDGSAWLRAQDGQSEAAYAAWFREHSDTDYEADAAHYFSMVCKLHPAYCGYVNAEGQPVLLRPLPKKKAVWYMQDGRMLLGAPGKLPQDATPLSPLFTTTRL